MRHNGRMDDAQRKRKNEKLAEAGRRWRANHPEQARQCGRNCYHRRQRREGKESRERTKLDPIQLEARRREAARARLRRWRERHPEDAALSRKKSYAAHADEQRAKSRAWYRNNRDRAREAMRWRAIKRNYGLTREQYEALGVECGICGATQTNGKKSRLHVDHDHATKKVRGLLCGACNCGIGYFKHDAALLRQSAEYCERHA